MATIDLQDTTTVRLPRDLVERVRVLAGAHDRSLSAELRVALRTYVDENGKSARRKPKPRKV